MMKKIVQQLLNFCNNVVEYVITHYTIPIGIANMHQIRTVAVLHGARQASLERVLSSLEVPLPPGVESLFMIIYFHLLDVCIYAN